MAPAAAGSSQYDPIASDFNSGTWTRSLIVSPFLDSLFKTFAQEQQKQAGGDGQARLWTAVDVGCGTGPVTIKLLQAGASNVLAFDASKNMLEEAKTEVDKFLHSNDQVSGKVKFAVASATNWSSIPEAQEGGFDLAICNYVLCTLLSKEEVSEAIAEIFKMLKPGGKLMIYESHVIQYMEADDKATFPLRHVWITPKEDGTRWGYFADEGKPREIIMTMNSGRQIKLTDRLYTLSSWVSFIVGAGFQITQLQEPYIGPKDIPTDAPDYMKFALGKPMGMCFECTKPLSQ